MNLWDIKAKNYSRYEERKTPTMEEFFAFFKEQNISFKDKNIIDIGCGTGVWSLHFTKPCKQVSVLDSSKLMLDILRQDLATLGAKNLNIIEKDFKDYEKDKDYDIAFLSLCPVLNTKRDFKLFLSLAPQRIYINFDSKRTSSFLDPLFIAFDNKPKDFGKNDFECYLKEEKIPYIKKSIDEERIIKRNHEEAFETAKWHLGINGAVIDEAKLRALIPKEGVEDRLACTIKCLLV